jgi:hypothetical protein
MRKSIAVAAAVLLSLITYDARAHDGPHLDPRAVIVAQAQNQTPAPAAKKAAEEDSVNTTAPGVTGQAPYRFKIKTRAATIARSSWEDLRKAHGGFAVDRRQGKGEAYFGLPNTGLLRVSADMNKVDILDASPEFKDGVTTHNASIWYDKDGTPFLVFPGVDKASILTADLNGKLLNKLDAPTPDEMTVPAVKDYFAKGGKFIPTDAVYYQGMYYITTGYSPLDYVLTAKVTSTKPYTTKWNGLAFGGKGDADGQFQTGHGITVHPDGKSLVVADRPKNRLERFSPEGKFLDQYMLPPGTLPCDTDYLGEYTLVPCLEGADKSKGAPIYLIKGGQIVSTIVCREDLGLVRFKHVHNAVLREVGGKLYIIAQAWNPGDFVVLEQTD